MVTVSKDLTNTMGTDCLMVLLGSIMFHYNTHSVTEVTQYFRIYGPFSTGPNYIKLSVSFGVTKSRMLLGLNHVMA